jgi:hypothetical protein
MPISRPALRLSDDERARTAAQKLHECMTAIQSGLREERAEERARKRRINDMFLFAAELEGRKPAADDTPVRAAPGQTPPAPHASRKSPPDEAFIAYRLWVAGGKTQTELAALLTVNLRRPIDQGTVSRWLSAVNKWLAAENGLPDITQIKRKPASADAGRLDLGSRQDGRRHDGRRPSDKAS